MKTFIITGVSHVYGGHKVWGEQIQADTLEIARAKFIAKHAPVGWIQNIKEVTK